jgi:hypothetical protein
VLLLGAAVVVLEEAAAFWSVVLLVLGVCAGGFTGALALSPWALAWVVLVVAAGALALLVSVVGCWALPGAAGGLLLEALLAAALWSVLLVLGAAVLLAAAFWSVLLGAVVLLAEAFWSVLLVLEPAAPVLEA